MCIIVDANRSTDFFQRGQEARIYRAVDQGRIKVVVGGKLLTEYRTAGVLNQLYEYYRSGKARILPTHELIETAEDEYKQLGLRTNDTHILALAFVSGSRLLYSSDADLIDAFTGRDMLTPRGKVYTDHPRRSSDALMAGERKRCSFCQA